MGAVNDKPILVMANLMNVHELGDWSKIPKKIDVGYALNKELLNHYIEVLGCFFVGIRHPKLLENYTYEWKPTRRRPGLLKANFPLFLFLIKVK